MRITLPFLLLVCLFALLGHVRIAKLPLKEIERIAFSRSFLRPSLPFFMIPKIPYQAKGLVGALLHMFSGIILHFFETTLKGLDLKKSRKTQITAYLNYQTVNSNFKHNKYLQR